MGDDGASPGKEKLMVVNPMDVGGHQSAEVPQKGKGGGGDGSGKEKASPRVHVTVHSNSVDLLEFMSRVESQAEARALRMENYLDFAVKYAHDDEEEDKPDEDDGNLLLLLKDERHRPRVELGATRMAWALVFRLEEGDDAPESPSSGDESPKGTGTRVPCECVDLCERLWKIDFDIKCEVSTDGEELLVGLGLTYEKLCEEANDGVRPRMRLRSVKGAATFETDKTGNYALDLFVEDPTKATVFTSALCQRLVISRMMRLGGIDLEERSRYIERDDSMDILESHLKHHHHVRAKLLREVLSAHGAFREEGRKLFGDNVAKIAEAVIREPFFTIEPDHKVKPARAARIHAQQESMRLRGMEPVTYSDVASMVDTLNAWTAVEPGVSEAYVGALILHYPVHCDMEREYLTHHWGSFHLMCTPIVSGKTPEGANTECYFEADLDKRHCAPLFIPLDSIRDYFGDHVGMYSAWLNLYTRSMFFPAAFGFVTFLATFISGGIDDNPLVIPYSAYLCFWSAMFIGTWKRRETELRFLWGSEGFEETAPVRTQFMGVITFNDETQSSELVYSSMMKMRLKLTLSTVLTMILIIAVIVGAFSASLIRYHEAPKLCVDAPELLQTADLLCARCIIPVELPNSTNFTNHNLGNATNVTNFEGFSNSFGLFPFKIVPNKRAQFAQGECLAECDPGDPELGIPPSTGCFTNKNGTNEWYDGFPEGSTIWDKNKWKWSSAAANTILIVVFGNIYKGIAIGMNDWENHRTQTEYDDNLILKNFVFQFVNNYFVLFYIAYMRQVPLDSVGLDIDAECKSGSCLSELSIQLIAVFTTKTIVAQVMEVAGPRLKGGVKKVAQKMQLNKLKAELRRIADESMQLVIVGDSAEELMGIDDAAIKKRKVLAERESELQARLIAHSSNREQGADEGLTWEAQSFQEEYPNTFDDFNEMAIQFGYLVLFSPAYPLAPLLALANNILEIRVDAWKLCHTMRRPVWVQCEDIGSWSTVINLLGFIAILTNATMIAFVGKKFSASTEQELGGLAARTENWELWGLAVFIEHGLLLMRVLILLLFPATPAWLIPARQVLEYRLDNIKDNDHLEHEEELFRQNLVKCVLSFWRTRKRRCRWPEQLAALRAAMSC
jgi:hypothetical protein